MARHHDQFQPTGRATPAAGVLAWAHYGTKQALDSRLLCAVQDGFVLAGDFGVAVADAERRIVAGPDIASLGHAPEALGDVFVAFNAKDAAQARRMVGHGMPIVRARTLDPGAWRAGRVLFYAQVEIKSDTNRPED